MDKTDADKEPEMAKRPRKPSSGTAERTGNVRQMPTARRENVEAETTNLMEEVLRRENLMAATPPTGTREPH